MGIKSRKPLTPAEAEALEQVVGAGPGVLGLDERVELAARFRATSRDRSRQLDEVLLSEVMRRGAGLLRAQEHLGQVRAKMAELLASPWHPAIVVRLLEALNTPARAQVVHAGVHRVVSVADGVALDALVPGAEVFLGNGLNVVVGTAPERALPCGETATFERYANGGSIVLKWREETVVARPAAGLQGVELRAGDVVRWDHATMFVFERLERPDGSDRFLEETPRETFADVGGLRPQIERLQRSIGLHLFHAEVAQRYRQRRNGSALLVGSPGTGKTMLARAFCNWLARQSGAGRARFMNIKPAGLHSVWYSQSEANYREVFRLAREAGAAEPDVPVVLFFDEVDAIGAARGQWNTRTDDRVQTAFMAELDGLESRGNVLVLAATNRRAAIDPALLRPGRLGDLVIEIPRPNMMAAREIFAKYLPADIPYAAAGDVTKGAARARLLEGIVSTLFAPNGEGAVATLRARDGRERTVRVADVLSGADIRQIATTATERACVREIETGEVGVRLDDLRAAAAEQLEHLARVLTPASCRQYVTDLSDDFDVVGVEPLSRRRVAAHRYLSAA